MKRHVALGLLLGTIVFVGNTFAGEAASQPTPVPQPSVLQEQAAPPVGSQTIPAPTPDPDARGLDLNSDGTLSAQVTFIEAGTLKLRPIAGATVSFVQNRTVITQARTEQDGRFTTTDLLRPWGTYSVFVNHPEWFAAFGTYMRPYDTQPVEADKPVAEKGRSVNQLAFASDIRLVQSQDLMAAGTGSPVQAVPAGDFQAFMGQGAPAPDGLTEAPIFGPGGMVGGMGGGGGGMGGGAGGAGGIGGALGAVGLALGAAALANEDQNEPPLSSPFKP